MEIDQAIKILEIHNRWRRGEDVEIELKPIDIGNAIDTVVNSLKTKLDCKSCKYLSESNDKYCDDCSETNPLYEIKKD